MISDPDIQSVLDDCLLVYALYDWSNVLTTPYLEDTSSLTGLESDAL